MKTWRIILSIYVTLLAIVPCCAFDGDHDDTAATEQNDHHNEEEAHDCTTPCSPFFNCNSCSVSFLQTNLSFDFVLAGSDSYIPVSYNSDIPQSISGKIWQPPKIG